jgi:hypothetical protein
VKNVEEDLDEQERNLLRDFCKAAMKRSRYVTTSGMYKVFDRDTEPEKVEVAELLRYKEYIKIETKDPMYSLLPKGVEYCNKHKSQRSAKLSLKEKRGKFIRDFYGLVEGDDSRLVFDQELYPFGENHGYTKDEIYSLALHFDGLGLMKAEPVLGRRIAVLRLTPIGTRYIEEGEKGPEHQYYDDLEHQHSEKKIKFKATAKSTVLGKPCVFLCYARSDGTAVRELYRVLQSHGFKPWIDTEDIPAGAEWEPTISKAIQHSDFFILCLTRNSVDRRGIMQKEIRAAFEKKEEMLDDDIYLISVRMEDCEVKDEKLRKFQWVDLFRNDGHDKLLFALHEGMKRRKQRGK